MESISRRRALALGGSTVLGAARVAASTGTAGAATDWNKLVVITANIGRKPHDRERAIRDVRNAVRFGDRLAKPLVGWQEIREDDPDDNEPRWINEYLGTSYRNIFEYDSSAHRVPMSIPTAYNIVDRKVTFCHGGKAGVSPHRVITQAVLARADDPETRFVFANTHYVAGAWNGQEDPYEAWRDEMWAQHFRIHRDDVLAFWRSRGYPVIWTGDVNRSPMPLLMPNYEMRAFARGIDQIGWVSGTNGTQLRLLSTKIVPMYIEDSHDARVAIMEIRRA